MRPASGVSKPATERRIVVLPLPDCPSRATTSPAFKASETPFRISTPPIDLRIPSTVSSRMETHSQPQCQKEADADKKEVDDKKSGDEVEPAAAEQGDNQRADHFGIGTKQVDAGRIFTAERHENDQPPSQPPVFDTRQRK